MSNIWSVFENLNDYVNVVDVDSYEIVYMNKKMRDVYGYASNSDVAGKNCYDVMQNSWGACTLCSIEELSEGCFKEWRDYIPLVRKYLLFKDTLVEEGGRRLRLEFAFDIGAAGGQYNSYQNLEAIVNEGLRAALMEPTPDRSIEVELEYIGKTLRGGRVYIFERNKDGRDDNTYEWVAPGYAPAKQELQNLPPEICDVWYDSFQEGSDIVIENIEEIRERRPREYESLKRRNIHSLVAVPLYENRKVIGFYGVDNPPEESFEYAATMLQIMGNFIVSSLKRRNLVREFETLSFSDQLTKLGNRHAMKAFIKDEADKAETVGVAYCDLIGLKAINDSKGHEEGDSYIISAGECMRRAFGGSGVFRIGGDEFLALCPAVSEEEFAQQVANLRDYLRESSVNMSIGSAMCLAGNDVQSAVKVAEERMYEDKSNYYRTSGIDRRRRRRD